MTSTPFQEDNFPVRAHPGTGCFAVPAKGQKHLATCSAEDFPEIAVEGEGLSRTSTTLDPRGTPLILAISVSAKVFHRDDPVAP